MQIGMVGLGRMGLNMARRLKEGGHEVYGFDRNPESVREAAQYGIKGTTSLSELASQLAAPRVVWLMVPAGAPVDEAIGELKAGLRPGDVIIDGGNSYYRDAIRREGELMPAGIRFMDVGVSGGIWGLKEGYCLMAGGDKEVFKTVEPAFKTLAQSEGYLYGGPIGAGHYLKMVHNGIEYGMMEAYGEGFELLKASPYGEKVDFGDVARLWNRGSVVRSWLLELLERAFRADRGLTSIKGYVEDSGEGRWMVKEAVDSGVTLPVITESLFRRFRSRAGDESFAEKVLAALRKEFGGHVVKKN